MIALDWRPVPDAAGNGYEILHGGGSVTAPMRQTDFHARRFPFDGKKDDLMGQYIA